MSTAAVADAFWILAVIQALTLRRRSDSTILRCALAFAAAFTLSQHSLYVPLDRMLGGQNTVALFAGLMTAVATYLLSRSVIAAVAPKDYRVVSVVSRILLGCALLTQAVTFLAVRGHPTDPNFTMVYGDHPAVLRYAITMVTYSVIVLALTGSAALAYFNRMNAKRFRIGFLVVGAACVLGTLDAVVDGIRAFLRYRYDFGGLDLTAAPEDLLSTSAFLLLATGLAIPSLMGLLDDTRLQRHARRRVERLEPVWRAATRHRRDQLIRTRGSQTDRLHRMLVEIRDAFLHRPTLEDELGDEALMAVEEAERWLNRAGHTG